MGGLVWQWQAAVCFAQICMPCANGHELAVCMPQMAAGRHHKGSLICTIHLQVLEEEIMREMQREALLRSVSPLLAF